MGLFNKIDEGEHIKNWINYRPAYDGTEIIVKIPLWVFWRENYLDFETKNYKSGKAIWSFMIYIRRRSDSVMPQTYIRPYYRWIFDYMFGLSPYGKQKVMLKREKGYYIRTKEVYYPHS